jgi:hypothetical protein
MAGDDVKFAFRHTGLRMRRKSCALGRRLRLEAQLKAFDWKWTAVRVFDGALHFHVIKRLAGAAAYEDTHPDRANQESSACEKNCRCVKGVGLWQHGTFVSAVKQFGAGRQ